MEILLVFILKIIDNILATAKTIYINKEKYVIASLFNAFSTFFYLILIVQIAKSNDIKSIIAMCVATFIGTYLPGVLIKKSEREKLFIFDITSDTLETGKQFADEIRDNNIAITTYSARDKHMNKVLTCKVYCRTKEESRIVKELLNPNFKYNIDIPEHEEERKHD